MDGHAADLSRCTLPERTTLGVLIGSQLRWLRVEAGLTQEELARRVGSYRPIVSRVERGVHGLDLDTVYRYAAGLGVDPVHDVLVVLEDYDLEVRPDAPTALVLRASTGAAARDGSSAPVGGVARLRARALPRGLAREVSRAR